MSLSLCFSFPYELLKLLDRWEANLLTLHSYSTRRKQIGHTNTGAARVGPYFLTYGLYIDFIPCVWGQRRTMVFERNREGWEDQA